MRSALFRCRIFMIMEEIWAQADEPPFSNSDIKLTLSINGRSLKN